MLTALKLRWDFCEFAGEVKGDEEKEKNLYGILQKTEGGFT